LFHSDVFGSGNGQGVLQPMVRTYVAAGLSIRLAGCGRLTFKGDATATKRG